MTTDLQLGPPVQVAVVGPLHDDADGADHRGIIGVDLVAAAGDVVGPGGADRLDRRDDLLVLLLPDAQYLVVDLLRGRRAAAGRIDVQDDGLHGGVVAEFAQLGIDLVGVGDDAVMSITPILEPSPAPRVSRRAHAAVHMTVISRNKASNQPPMIPMQNHAECRGGGAWPHDCDHKEQPGGPAPWRAMP